MPSPEHPAELCLGEDSQFLRTCRDVVFEQTRGGSRVLLGTFGAGSDKSERNGWAWGSSGREGSPFTVDRAALALCVGLLKLAVCWPALVHILLLVPLGVDGCLVVVSASLTGLLLGQVSLFWRRARSRTRDPVTANEGVV